MADCACGCGQAVATRCRYRHGHWAKANRDRLRALHFTGARSNHGDGYLTRYDPERKVHKLDHILVAERALRRALKRGEVVHHVNENRADNKPSNLVICTRAYHAMIHRRMRALAASGHAGWRKCYICAQHDAPENLDIPKREGKGSIRHLSCLRAKYAERKRNAHPRTD
jgi:predicted nucleic acid-binding Zn ribbon protein